MFVNKLFHISQKVKGVLMWLNILFSYEDEYGCSLVAKLIWKKKFFLKKYLFFTKYTLFAEKMSLYGKKF